MEKSNKFKCRVCGGDELYLEQCIVTRSGTYHDEEGNLVYEEPQCFYDEVIEEFTCYGCNGCGRNLAIEDEHGSRRVVTENNLQQYIQKYCSDN